MFPFSLIQLFQNYENCHQALWQILLVNFAQSVRHKLTYAPEVKIGKSILVKPQSTVFYKSFLRFFRGEVP